MEELKEEWFLAGFYQQGQKHYENAWQDQHVKFCTFKMNYLVLIYDSKFDKFLGKLKTHWLGPYAIEEITEGGAVQLVKLNGELFPRKFNGSHLKLYISGLTI